MMKEFGPWSLANTYLNFETAFRSGGKKTSLLQAQALLGTTTTAFVCVGEASNQDGAEIVTSNFAIKRCTIFPP